ncbi:MAG TPA: ABC transporter ATP-binding protein [Capillibacterium sp.]
MVDQFAFALDVEGLSFCYGEKALLEEVSFRVPVQGFTGLIGPNGSGKTTLLRCLNKALTPTRGRVLVAGRELSGLKVKDLARMMGVVPQQWEANFPFTVEELVMMGRFPHWPAFGRAGQDDRAIVREAMLATKTWSLAKRPVTELSGGECQRVLLAQALAQTPRLLLLDEPTSHLDVSQTLEICELLTKLIREKGLTVLAVFHDLNLAARYCHDLIMLKEGKIYAQGSPNKVLTPENLAAVFGVKAVIQADPVLKKPYLLFFPMEERASQQEGQESQE